VGDARWLPPNDKDIAVRTSGLSTRRIPLVELSAVDSGNNISYATGAIDGPARPCIPLATISTMARATTAMFLEFTITKDANRNQTFTYDSLNRLISAQNAGTDCTSKVLRCNFSL
jgi:hypothetical protein